MNTQSLSNPPIPAGTVVPPGLPDVVARYDNPRILDFGCGYGRSLIGLLEAGWDIWGVDVAEAQLTQALAALAAGGFGTDRAVLLDPAGRSRFPDASFDVVFSTQVLEHVEDLETVAGEIARLLRPGGVSIHEWPGRWRIVEPHLRMPFLHWLPKNRARRLAISGWHRIGVGPPRPPELPPEADRRALVDFEYRYSVEQTFYRPARSIERSFRRQGLETCWPARPKVEALPRPLRGTALRAVLAAREARLVAWKPERSL